MSENGFPQVLQALSYFDFQDHLDPFEELFDEVTCCDETCCEDTVRIGRIRGWSVCWAAVCRLCGNEIVSLKFPNSVSM